MRVAITGSSGFIGRALQASLTSDGHKVVRIVRGATSGADGETVGWDIDAGLIDAPALEGLDGVVHLAGESIGERRWSDAQKQRILESRTKGTALLAEALASLDTKPPVLVSASAVGVYGDRADEQLTEESPPGDGFLAEVVLAWEAATAPAQGAGIRVPLTRSGVVLDAHGGALERLARLCRFGILGRLGSGKQWMSWISLADEVRAIRFLLDPAAPGDLTGPVNLTSPSPVTNEVFTKALGRVLHRPTILPIPAFGPKLVLGAELAEALLLDGQRVLPERLLDAGFEFRHTDLEPALRELLDR
jgi:uncharacterized protein (TIGR01777 family)